MSDTYTIPQTAKTRVERTGDYIYITQEKADGNTQVVLVPACFAFLLVSAVVTAAGDDFSSKDGEKRPHVKVRGAVC